MLQIYEKIYVETHVEYFYSCVPDVFLIELQRKRRKAPEFIHGDVRRAFVIRGCIILRHVV